VKKVLINFCAHLVDPNTRFYAIRLGEILANQKIIVSNQATQDSNSSLIYQEIRSTKSLLNRCLSAHGCRMPRRKTPLNTTENPTAGPSGEQSNPVEEQEVLEWDDGEFIHQNFPINSFEDIDEVMRKLSINDFARNLLVFNLFVYLFIFDIFPRLDHPLDPS